MHKLEEEEEKISAELFFSSLYPSLYLHSSKMKGDYHHLYLILQTFYVCCFLFFPSPASSRLPIDLANVIFLRFNSHKNLWKGLRERRSFFASQFDKESPFRPPSSISSIDDDFLSVFFFQSEIVKRLSAIVGQVLPFLSQEHQQQVATAVERAKQVTMSELNSVIGVRNKYFLPSSFPERNRSIPILLAPPMGVLRVLFLIYLLFLLSSFKYETFFCLFPFPFFFSVPYTCQKNFILSVSLWLC